MSLLLTSCQVASSPADPEGAIQSLIVLLRDPSPDVRRTAALSLGKIAEPQAVTALVAALSDTDVRVRQHASWALGQIGEAAREPAGMALVGLLRDPSADVVMAAAQALGQVGTTPQVLASLLDAVHSGPPARRHAAVKALGWLESPAALPALLRALQDEDRQVRQAAVSALGELADPHSLPALVSRLRDDPDTGVRSEAAFRLGKFGNDQVIAALEAAAQHDAAPIVRRWASWALTELREAAGRD